jgi:diguanylate cyclase (GGDEF)-like protein
MSTMALGIASLLGQHRRREADLEARVGERTAALSVANTRLLEMATTDELTGTLNRRALFDLLQREIDRHRRYSHALSLIVLDIDHFKQVNDVYGHAAGDSVLRHVAEVARAVIRSSDSLARYGGEEFVVTAPETSEDRAVELAERIRLRLRSHDIPVNGGTLRLTASFGVTALHHEDGDAGQVLRRADRALYAAKAAGRDRVERAGSRASDEHTFV